jgi:hypothetical protein
MSAGLAKDPGLSLSNAERIEKEVRQTLKRVFGSFRSEQSKTLPRQQNSDGHKGARIRRSNIVNASHRLQPLRTQVSQIPIAEYNTATSMTTETGHALLPQQFLERTQSAGDPPP